MSIQENNEFTQFTPNVNEKHTLHAITQKLEPTADHVYYATHLTYPGAILVAGYDVQGINGKLFVIVIDHESMQVLGRGQQYVDVNQVVLGNTYLEALAYTLMMQTLSSAYKT